MTPQYKGSVKDIESTCTGLVQSTVQVQCKMLTVQCRFSTRVFQDIDSILHNIDNRVQIVYKILTVQYRKVQNIDSKAIVQEYILTVQQRYSALQG